MGSTWKAVADDSRRHVLLLLKDREKMPSEIATHFDFTLPALSTHLKVLNDAGLFIRSRLNTLPQSACGALQKKKE